MLQGLKKKKIFPVSHKIYLVLYNRSDIFRDKSRKKNDLFQLVEWKVVIQECVIIFGLVFISCYKTSRVETVLMKVEKKKKILEKVNCCYYPVV